MLAIALVHRLVGNETCEEVHTVHHWMMGQSACQLHYILDLHSQRTLNSGAPGLLDDQKRPLGTGIYFRVHALLNQNNCGCNARLYCKMAASSIYHLVRVLLHCHVALKRQDRTVCIRRARICGSRGRFWHLVPCCRGIGVANMRTCPPVSASLPSSMFSPRTSPCMEINTMYRRSTRPRKGLSPRILSDCADVAVPGLLSPCLGVTDPSLSLRPVCTRRLPGPGGRDVPGNGELDNGRLVVWVFVPPSLDVATASEHQLM